MSPQEAATLEQTKTGFAFEKLFEIRAQTLDAVKRIAEQVQVGMLEEDANKMAIARGGCRDHDAEHQGCRYVPLGKADKEEAMTEADSQSGQVFACRVGQSGRRRRVGSSQSH